jgi:hypothetical protein
LPAYVKYMRHPTVIGCQEAVGQAGSISWVDLTLPLGKVLLVEVSTSVQGQSTNSGFFLRPHRLTRNWGKPQLSGKTASFHVAHTGQFSVEFAADSIWRNYTAATTFDALMLFANPEISLPSGATVISAATDSSIIDLGPSEAYVFKAGVKYDWGRDQVFKVHDNTAVYFEPGAHVRGRIVQTEETVSNVTITGLGTLETHYDLLLGGPDNDDAVVGASDDRTRQNLVILGTNIKVFGVTLINTNPDCGHNAWGYCASINPNWIPLPNPSDPFDAAELQKDPPYKARKAYCQQKNMDDSPNYDLHLENCPTSHPGGGGAAEGGQMSYVKCMTWQMGQDGLDAGKYGTVQNSFVRVIDDAIKPWDSYGVYQNITIWQLTLGWPINLGWWAWNQDDISAVIDSVYVIHNHNWASSKGWPATQSGQCTIGAVYGSGSVQQSYRINNIFVETAASCAVGLQISKSSFNRHLTPKGCVGSIQNMSINGMFFDEEFYKTGGYDNFISGETNPNAGCVGNLSGKVTNMHFSSLVAGQALSVSDFVVDTGSVSGLVMTAAVDPHPAPAYTKYVGKNAYDGNGGINIDRVGVSVFSSTQCVERCHADLSCDCVTFQISTSMCFKLRSCVPDQFDSGADYDVYVRPWAGA